MLDRLYAAAALARRRWYERHPGHRRRLERPVVSVGNVSVGGSGKTPVTARLACLLLEAGHRPSILTRGYGRRDPAPGVTVVSDRDQVRADVDRAGDEPLMLARALPGVPVLVSSDRYLAGRLAERRFGCTVHLLDDGFQHFGLHRDIDVVLVGQDDLERPVTLPAGRLREPLAALRSAQALILEVSDAALPAALATVQQVGVERWFRLRRALGRPRLAGGDGTGAPAEGTRVLAVAGVARPQGFFSALAVEGWTLAGQLAFSDHHRFTGSDVRRILGAMREARAGMVVTTEKDWVRLQALEPLPFTVALAPLEVAVEPSEPFAAWLVEALSPLSLEP
jgi:tetraacyldisaccharide 4'-kinase